jgi:hypothetical protein
MVEVGPVDREGNGKGSRLVVDGFFLLSGERRVILLSGRDVVATHAVRSIQSQPITVGVAVEVEHSGEAALTAFRRRPRRAGHAVAKRLGVLRPGGSGYALHVESTALHGPRRERPVQVYRRCKVGHFGGRFDG